MAKRQSKTKTDDQPSFEQALERLEGIVHLLEEGDIGLDDALVQYEEGVKLLRRSYDLLSRAERRIELLSGVDADGNAICRPFDDPGSQSLQEKAQLRSRRRSASQGPPGGGTADSDQGDTDMDAPGGLF